MSKLFRGIFNIAVIGIMCLLVGSVFTMTALAVSPGDVGAWADTTSLPQSLFDTNSVTYNGYVFVIGGSDLSTDKNTVYSAPLNLDGAVGIWITTTPLPQNLSNSTSVVYNDYVYVMGGTSGGSPWLDTVYSAPLNLNGTVGAWTTSVSTLPEAINSTTSIAYNGYIYVMGGYDGSNALDTVYSAPVNNGTVGAWASASTLPQALQFTSAITYNGYVYVIGGRTSSFGYSDIVYSAPLGASGTIDAWATSANTLPQGLYGHNAVSYNGYVYVIGGRGSDGYSDAVYSAPLGSSGTVGTWATSPNTLPQAMQFASAITYNGYVYNIGGNGSEGNINNVYFAQLTGYLPPEPTLITLPQTGANSPLNAYILDAIL